MQKIKKKRNALKHKRKNLYVQFNGNNGKKSEKFTNSKILEIMFVKFKRKKINSKKTF